MPERGHFLLIDDDAELASLMRAFFDREGYSLRYAEDPQLGLDLALTGEFELIILDAMMPKLDGFTLLERLRRTSMVPVLMLTARTDQSSRLRGFGAGADDYLPKPFDPLELLARVRAILRRASGRPVAERVEVNGVELDPRARRVAQHGQPLELTSAEFEILDALISQAGRVVSRDELMQRLYQRNSSPLDRAIDVHISHLRKKLAGGDEMIRTVRGVGYQFCLTSVDTGR